MELKRAKAAVKREQDQQWEKVKELMQDEDENLQGAALAL